MNMVEIGMGIQNHLVSGSKYVDTGSYMGWYGLIYGLIWIHLGGDMDCKGSDVEYIFGFSINLNKNTNYRDYNSQFEHVFILYKYLWRRISS